MLARTIGGWFVVLAALAAPAHAGLVNIAPSAKVRQSSTAYDGVAGRANDGITNGLWGFLSVTHTTNAPGQWLELDLGAAQAVEEVVVHNRTDSGGVNGIGMRLDQAIVQLSDKPCDQGGGLVTSPPLDGKKLVNPVAWPQPIAARYVCVRHQTRADYLSVAEVEVFASDRLVVAQETVNVARSAEPNNLARSALARQSSTAMVRTGTGWTTFQTPLEATLAIDGNRSATTTATRSQTNPVANSWFELNFGERAAIGEVSLFNRSPNADWLNGAVVQLADQPCDAPGFAALATSSPYAGSAPQMTFRFPAAPRAQFVCVRQARAVALSLAEIEVLEAPPEGRLVNLARGRPALVHRKPQAASTYTTTGAGWLTDGDPSAYAARPLPAGQEDVFEIDLGEGAPELGWLVYHVPGAADLKTVDAHQILIPPPGIRCSDPAARAAPGFGSGLVNDMGGRTWIRQLPPGTRGRYVCLVLYKEMKAAELQVFPAARQSLARGKSVTSSGLASGTAAALTDGVTGTGAIEVRATTNAWVQIDLGEAQEVDVIAVYPAAGAPTNVAVTFGPNPCSAGGNPSANVLDLGDGIPRAYPLAYPALTPGRYVCLLGPVATLAVTEVEVFGPSTIPSFPAVARQSSTGYGAGPMRAIDGRRVGTWAAADLTVSGVDGNGNPNDSAPWFEVDLISPQRIREVVIYNRGDGCCPERLYGARVELSLDPCDEPWRRVVEDQWVPAIDERQIPSGWTVTATGSAPRRGQLDFPSAPTARYVCVRHDRRQFLSLGEVEVRTGAPVENLARRGVARQSTTLGDETTGPGADRAIDGWVDGQFTFGSVAHTADPATDPTAAAAPPWFEIDLLGQAALAAESPADLPEPPAIREIAIYNRTDAARERLTNARVELKAYPCDEPKRKPVWAALVAPDVLGKEPLRRTVFSLYRTKDELPRARYVCISHSQPAILQLAEVQVFGTGTETLPAPDRRPVPPIIPTAKVPDAGPAPGIESTSAGTSTEVKVSYGGVTLPTCTFTPDSDSDGDGTPEHRMACPNTPEVRMEGALVSASSYDLTSTATVDLDGLLGGLFSFWPDDVRQAFKPLPLTGVRLRLTSDRGFFLQGTLGLGPLAGSAAPVARALGGAAAALGLGSVAPPRLELIPAFSNQTASAILRLVVLDGICKGPDVPVVDGQLRLANAAVVLSVSAGTGGVQVTAGIEGLAYLKPTKNDPWLAFYPAIDLGAGTRSQSVTIKGRVTGACEATCASACGCDLTECQAAWSPVGMPTVRLEQGYVELGASTAPSAVLPVVNLAFENVQVGSARGTYAIAFDYPRKAFGFRIEADRLPLLAALDLAGLGSVSALVPRELSIDNPVLSFSSTGVALFDVTIPQGLRIKGGLDLPTVGLRGSVDASLKGSGLVDLEKSVAQQKLVIGGPTGRLALSFDAGRMLDKVFRALPFGGLEREVIERAFWITGFEVGVTVGATVGLDTRLRFRLFGKSFDEGFGASFDVDAIASAVASYLEKQVKGPLVALFNGAVGAAVLAAKEIENALAKGTAVVVNGVLTVGSKVVTLTAAGIPYIEDFVEDGVDAISSCFGLC